jgi:hypothetical protein
MITSPSPNGGNGGSRDERGRFVTGNPGGPGNPLGGAVAKLRAALVEAVTPDAMRDIARGLIARAKRGDTAAAQLLFRHILGRPLEFDILERIERLEADAAADN